MIRTLEIKKMYFPNIQILLLCDKKCCFLCVIPKSEQKRSFCAYLQIECDFLKLTNVLNWLLGFLGIRPLISSYFYKLDHIGYLKGMFPQISEKIIFCRPADPVQGRLGVDQLYFSCTHILNYGWLNIQEPISSSDLSVWSMW